MGALRKAKDKFGFPELPSSLRSDSVELDDLRKNQAARLSDSNPYIHPYLGLRARLSQVWINRWTILLLLVLVRVLLLIGSLNDNIGEAKIKALSACTKVEDIGSAMASMPHYLSVGVNELSASGIEKVVNGMVSMLQLAVTVVENLILFVISMMTSTYVCLATSLIHGSLQVSSEVIKKMTEKLNDAVDSVGDGLSNGLTSFDDALGGILDKIDNLAGVFGGGASKPSTDFISNAADKLKNIDIDTSGITDGLDSLNKNIPTFDEVKNFTDAAISVPFDFIRQKINESFGAFVFDRDVFPVAQKQQLTFCSDNDKINKFFANLYDTAKTARIVFIVIIIIAAILVCLPMAWIEIRRWRRMQKHCRMVEQPDGYDPFDIIYISSRPNTAEWGVKIASKFKGKRQILVRWAIAYATTLPALFVLALALAGLFSALCQFIMLRAIENQAPGLAEQVGEFADGVVTSLEDVSKSWAQDANTVILDFNSDVNDDLLGWVKEATSAVNGTLNTFTEEMDKGINNVLGDTILKEPAKDIIRCLIGLKVEAVQKGLTFLHDRAHVDFPLFTEDIFSLGAQKSISDDSDLTTFLASPSTVTTDEVTGAVQHVTDALYKGMIEEVFISVGLLLVYVIVVLIGVMRMLVGMAMPDKTRAEGGIRQQYFHNVDDDMDNTGGAAAEYGHGQYQGPEGVGKSSGAAVDDHDAYARDGSHDEKYMQSSVPAGKVRAVPGHVRSSSYGHYDTANKF